MSLPESDTIELNLMEVGYLLACLTQHKSGDRILPQQIHDKLCNLAHRLGALGYEKWAELNAEEEENVEWP